MNMPRMRLLTIFSVVAIALLSSLFAHLVLVYAGNDLKHTMHRAFSEEFGEDLVRQLKPANIIRVDESHEITSRVVDRQEFSGQPILELNGISKRIQKNTARIIVNSTYDGGFSMGVTKGGTHVIWPLERTHVRMSLLEVGIGYTPVRDSLLAHGYSIDELRNVVEGAIASMEEVEDRELLELLLFSNFEILKDAKTERELVAKALLLDYRLMYRLIDRVARVEQERGGEVYIIEGPREGHPGARTGMVHAFGPDGEAIFAGRYRVNEEPDDAFEYMVCLFAGL